MKPDLPDGQYYRFLDFPTLPAELEQRCLDQVNNKDAFIFNVGERANQFERRIIVNGKPELKRQCIFEVYRAPDEVYHWLYDHKIIDTLDCDVGVQRSYGGNILFPHRDTTPDSNDQIFRVRYMAWNYLLSESGPVTNFYRSQNLADVCESVILPRSTWHELIVSELHGVNNIVNDRISLSVTVKKIN